MINKLPIKFKKSIFTVIILGIFLGQSQLVSASTISDNILLPKQANAQASAVTILYEGKSGDLNWSIDSDGHLLISGTGNYVLDYEYNSKFYPTWNQYRNEIKSATVKVSGITTAEQMFGFCTNMESIDLSGLDTSNITNMSNMFRDCRALNSVNVSNFNTSNVTDMGNMFYNCQVLKKLDLSNFNTSNVTNMGNMFSYCSALENIDVSNFNTSSVADMGAMFTGCKNLESLNLSSFDLTKVTTDAYRMQLLITNNEKLVHVDAPCKMGKYQITLPNTYRIDENTTSEEGWKYYANGIEYGDAAKITNEGEGMVYARLDGDTTPFAEVKTVASGISGGITWSIDSSGLLTISGTGDYEPSDTNQKPAWCNVDKELIQKIRIAKVHVTGITSTANMFNGLSNLGKIDLNGLDTSKVTDMCSMFRDCRNLITLDLSNFNTENVTDMSYMFYYCIDLTALNLSGLDTNKVTNMSHMFTWCNTLTNLDVSSFQTSNVQKMDYLFANCMELISLDLSSFDMLDISNKNTNNMLGGCGALKEVIPPRQIRNSKFELPKKENYLWHAYIDSVDNGTFQNVSDGCEGYIFKLSELPFYDVVIHYPSGNYFKIVSGSDTVQADTKMEDFVLKTTSSYYLPDNYVTYIEGLDENQSINGITVTRNDFSQLTISGTPTADVTITLTMPTEKTPLPTPDIKIDYKNEALIGFINNATYHIGIISGQSVASVLPLGTPPVYPLQENDLGCKIQIQRICNSNNEPTKTNSAILSFVVPTRPEAPTIMTEDAATGKNNGKLTGVNDTMEYKATETSSWTPISVGITEVTNLPPGNYDVRTKATDSSFAGHAITLCIKETGTTNPTEPPTSSEEEAFREQVNQIAKEYDISQETLKITETIITSQTSDKDLKGSEFGKLKARIIKNKANSITLKWNKVRGADGYIIYGNKCNSKNKKYKLQKLNIVSSSKTSYTAKKLKKGTYYKFLVVAYKNVAGKNLTLTASPTLHSVTNGSKYGVAKLIKIEKIGKKKNTTKVVLKKGKTTSIKAKEVNKTKKIKRHRKLVYESSNKNIAIVSKSGKIKAKKKGKCKIYVYAQNGIYKTIRVTVK